VPDPWDVELESELPRFLQDRTQFGPEFDRGELRLCCFRLETTARVAITTHDPGYDPNGSVDDQRELHWPLPGRRSQSRCEWTAEDEEMMPVFMRD
jgi:hypothetical protein